MHLQTVRILEREDALTPRMEEAGEEAPRHTPRPPTRGVFSLIAVKQRTFSLGSWQRGKVAVRKRALTYSSNASSALWHAW